MAKPATRANLIDALSRADEFSRDIRADRIEWLAQHSSRPGGVMGDMAALHMMEEARHCFISGYFIGTILLATSFIEQTLSEELAGVASEKERKTLATMIKAGRRYLSMADDLLDRTDRLRELRNPFSHRKADDHPHALGTRFLATKAHPASILEADAKLAMTVMYEWFRRTLRSVV
ncbi:hypothetical protein [Bordetella bronchiseptica]|uniref:hypothetical protein n=1 Tax=Bordetella bronchiseptica TaxID=518 RepID=UPI0009B895C3|nr:hypothetical protein [Bordetella bronchiseptica]